MDPLSSKRMMFVEMQCCRKRRERGLKTAASGEMDVRQIRTDIAYRARTRARLRSVVNSHTANLRGILSHVASRLTSFGRVASRHLLTSGSVIPHSNRPLAYSLCQRSRMSPCLAVSLSQVHVWAQNAKRYGIMVISSKHMHLLSSGLNDSLR